MKQHASPFATSIALSDSIRTEPRIGRLARSARAARAACTGAFGVALIAGSVAAQSAAVRPGIDRATLEMQAKNEQRPEQAARLRERLQEGDFNVGDRVILELQRDSTVTHDTLVVRAGRVVSVEGVPDIPLSGVLRSELTARMSERLTRYFKSPNVRTWSLFRVAILGEVQKPNFYDVPADLLVSDLVVLAGGPTASAALDRSIARRGTSHILEPERFRYALRSGQTLDELGFRAGDEIVIGKKKELSWYTIATVASIAVSLVITTVSLVHR